MTTNIPNAGHHMAEEIASQPDCWARAASLDASVLPGDGERVAVIGCGTSWFMAQSYATLRERAGRGVTDAFTASEAPLDRGYDVVVALTRSGTTTEVLEALEHVKGRSRTVAIVGDTETPIVDLVDDLVPLGFADERSVVQTRFASTALALLRASTGDSLDAAIEQGRDSLESPLDEEREGVSLLDAEQYTFLGSGWTIGLAHEAALKLREATQAWTESYPAKEYRHGPIAIAAPGRVTWALGEVPEGLDPQVRATGARFEHRPVDPMAELIRCQRVALERALRAGLNPDTPRNLTRSVILDQGHVG